MCLFSRLFLVALLISPCCCAAEGSGAEGLQLTLPREFYAVTGIPISIYFNNVVLTPTPEKYRFEVECEIGRTEKRRWSVAASPDEVGQHPLSILVRGSDGKQLARASTTLHVIPADAGVRRTIRLLIIGDSLTHATAYPNEIARLLTAAGHAEWRMFGTHKPESAAEGVAHEGYGGWTWQRFAAQYEPNPDGTHRKRSSPFVYLVNDQPRLDVERYLREECEGQRPDFVIFLLGINDCFSASPDDPDHRIDAMFKQTEILLSAFRRAAPEAQLGVCLTTPPNSRDAAFEANYKGRFPRWGWKRIQHRLVQRQLDFFAEQPFPKTFLVPTQLDLDPIDGYPANNGVHPNSSGYKQIGSSIYAWLKWRLAEGGTEARR